MLVEACAKTYHTPTLILRSCNNFGPGQHHEKLIPLIIKNLVAEKPLPVYGKGDNVRDWLYVEDHAEAIDLVLHSGTIGETYVIGGSKELKNLDLVHYLIRQVDIKLNRSEGSSLQLIEFVADRLGHDYRYAIDVSKISNELNWKASTSFKKGMDKTLNFYLAELL